MPVQAFFKERIEQGPTPEAEGQTIDMLNDGQALRYYQLTPTSQ